MEILKGTQGVVKFTVPATLSAGLVTFKKGDEEVGYPKTPTFASGVAQVNTPLSLSLEEGRYTAEFEFVFEGEDHVFTKDIYVVTPILELWEIQDILEGGTVEEATQLESAVRHVINAHTGQSFGIEEKTLTVTGSGNNALNLPERLISITTLNGLENLPGTYSIDPSGWY